MFGRTDEERVCVGGGTDESLGAGAVSTKARGTGKGARSGVTRRKQGRCLSAPSKCTTPLLSPSALAHPTGAPSYYLLPPTAQLSPTSLSTPPPRNLQPRPLPPNKIHNIPLCSEMKNKFESLLKPSDGPDIAGQSGTRIQGAAMGVQYLVWTKTSLADGLILINY